MSSESDNNTLRRSGPEPRDGQTVGRDAGIGHSAGHGPEPRDSQTVDRDPGSCDPAGHSPNANPPGDRGPQSGSQATQQAVPQAGPQAAPQSDSQAAPQASIHGNQGIQGVSGNHGAAGLNNEATRFILVGVLNTLLGTALTFGFYNLAHMSYWLSSGLSYILASIFSFFMNKTFTFRNDDSILRSGLRFALNIAVCYGLAFGLAKPGVLLVLGRWPELSPKLLDNAALLTGMVLFTAFNFVGQKFFAFRKSPK